MSKLYQRYGRKYTYHHNISHLLAVITLTSMPEPVGHSMEIVSYKALEFNHSYSYEDILYIFCTISISPLVIAI